MSLPGRTPPFTLAEILIAAPWTATERSHQDHDKGILLHRNMPDDEWSLTGDRIRAFEQEAREARAAALRRALAPFAHAVTSLFRSRRARG